MSSLVSTINVFVSGRDEVPERTMTINYRSCWKSKEATTAKKKVNQIAHTIEQQIV